ncbi:MAG: Gfo/Idh/MocA family oxidoreductase [Haloarculaceae archaeon]
MPYNVGVVGTGPGREVDIAGRSHSFGYRHGDAYAAHEDCDLVACADLVGEYAAAFAEEFGIAPGSVYEDHQRMLDAESLDLVSICTPVPTHADITVDCARASVQGVHCEKPMAATWGQAREMAQECDRNGVRLTFGHQRRFGEPFREAKRLLDDGRIGDLERVEISWGNVFDNGSHTVDLANYFNDEGRAAWVLGQVDYSVEHVRYGVPTADHAFVSWQYENGVHGVAATGDGVGLTGGPYDFYDCYHRLVGTDGVVEVGRRGGPPLRIRRDGEGWRPVDVPANLFGDVGRAVDDVVEALDGGESELAAENALGATEILFAAHESARRRGRVELPLDIDDHPLQSLVEAGEVVPERSDDRPPHPTEERGETPFDP